MVGRTVIVIHVILTVILVCTARVTPASAPTGAALAEWIMMHYNTSSIKFKLSMPCIYTCVHTCYTNNVLHIHTYVHVQNMHVHTFFKETSPHGIDEG